MENATEPLWWGNKRYHTLNWELRKVFGTKVFKIPLDAGFTCPNRDGKLSDKGCLFCSPRGSGDFAGDRKEDLKQQFDNLKAVMHKKWHQGKYIAYFQAFTNTYGDVEYLRKVYELALNQPEVVGLAIATRPDCLPEEVLDLLAEFNKKTYLWVELGLQTIHKQTARSMNLQYDYEKFRQSLQNLRKREIQTVAHIILGLPGETHEMMRVTGETVAELPIQGLKIHLLHLMKNTPLAQIYKDKPFPYLTQHEYIDLVADILEKIPPDVVIHRLTGDSPRSTLIGPEWSLNKWEVLNSIDDRLVQRNTWQGRMRGNL
ncbi:MAG TPA: TIGR01212 family radical SAM protein [Syntrophomonadaceae bacterium]|nr:TIGR01212 family radical SAM protein [Syntrophomonadaceae bacterium]HRX20376.1 TIGR01212 family radical SAM protein [Syntrophomonadaceae bacterium]